MYNFMLKDVYSYNYMPGCMYVSTSVLICSNQSCLEVFLFCRQFNRKANGLMFSHKSDIRFCYADHDGLLTQNRPTHRQYLPGISIELWLLLFWTNPWQIRRGRRYTFYNFDSWIQVLSRCGKCIIAFKIPVGWTTTNLKSEPLLTDLGTNDVLQEFWPVLVL